MLQEILQRCGIGKSVILVYLDIVKTQLKKVFLVRPSNINVRGGFRGRAPRPHPLPPPLFFLQLLPFSQSLASR